VAGAVVVAEHLRRVRHVRVVLEAAVVQGLTGFLRRPNLVRQRRSLLDRQARQDRRVHLEAQVERVEQAVTPHSHRALSSSRRSAAVVVLRA
jgi:hypothetical protein